MEFMNLTVSPFGFALLSILVFITLIFLVAAIIGCCIHFSDEFKQMVKPIKNRIAKLKLIFSDDEAFNPEWMNKRAYDSTRI